MAKKIKSKKETLATKDLEQAKENLEKAGEAVGDLFKGLFKGVVKILDVVGDMEKKGESERSYRKEVKGFTRSGKEFRGEAGWRLKTGLPTIPSPEKKGKKK